MRRLAKYIIPPARLLELASESAGARAEVDLLEGIEVNRLAEVGVSVDVIFAFVSGD